MNKEEQAEENKTNGRTEIEICKLYQNCCERAYTLGIHISIDETGGFRVLAQQNIFYPPTLDALDCFVLGFEAGNKKDS